jgi:hemolysin activation/secretion protein
MYGAVHAQGVLGIDPSGRPLRVPPRLPEEPLPQEPLPSPRPVPVLPPLPPPPTGPAEPLSLESVFVREIRVIGSTVFTPAELAEVTDPYANRALTVEDLESLRLALTRYYITRGYVNSGAIIPD